MPLNRQHTSCEAPAAKLLPAVFDRNVSAIIVIDMERLFKEQRLQHNNRLMVYAVNG